MTTFADVEINSGFKYDGELFLKTSAGAGFEPPQPRGGLAWSIYQGRKIKEWAFVGDEAVEPIALTRLIARSWK